MACNSGESAKAVAEGTSESKSDSKALGQAIEFKDDKLKSIYEHYIHLKNALVSSNSKDAQTAASQLNTAFSGVDNTRGVELSSHIATSSDLTVQRNHFDQLTAEVEHAIKSSGLKSGKVYKQYCPMAKDGNGAYWLASESDIKNPYYGDEMLTCGEVKEEIK